MTVRRNILNDMFFVLHAGFICVVDASTQRVSEQVKQQINQTSELLLSDMEGEAAVEALLVFLSVCHKVVTSR